jgi:hypothetical protein
MSPFFTNANYNILTKTAQVISFCERLNNILKLTPEHDQQMILPAAGGAYEIKCYIKEWSNGATFDLDSIIKK